jgi:Rieske Fe-S protein
MVLADGPGMPRRSPALKPAVNQLGSGATIAIADLPPCKGGMSRREFCGLAGSGLVALSLSACDPGAAKIIVGDGVAPTTSIGLGPPPPDGGATDLAQNIPHDGATGPNDLAGPQDLAQTSNCSGPYNAGAASAITVGAAKHLTDNVNFDLFLCRDSGGLYAMSAQCTHAGATLTHQSTQFHCPAHGATFDLNGQHPTSPAFSPLDHYALCVDGSGNVLIDYNTVVSASTRA